MSGLAKAVNYQGVEKRFGKVTAVHPVDLAVKAGEFLTLVGPSGCGKTTLLRMTAGLEAVTAGRIFVGEADVTDVAPNRRDTSIMFQDYALFPHKSLLDNIGYGLKMRGVDKNARNAAAQEWLNRIELPDYGKRYPHELSGGQRQRVALARALIVNPGVLLLDEPLGALDANLRRQLQGELRRMHSEVGLTFIYVTHDQEEALSMSDRIAVMRAGRIEQIGTPDEVYDRPRSEFVAKFMGVGNIFQARVDRIEGRQAVAQSADFGSCRFAAEGLSPGQNIALAIRPSHVLVSPGAGAGGNAAVIKVVDIAFAGDRIRVSGTGRGGGPVHAEAERGDPGTDELRRGVAVTVSWKAEHLVALTC